MSVKSKIQVPSYLIHKDSGFNEGFSGKDFGYVYKTGGYLINHGKDSLSGGYLHEIKNLHLTADIDFRKDFSIEICYSKDSYLKVLHIVGDNKIYSNTFITIARTAISVNYWNRFSRKVIYNPEQEPDVDGFINALIVRKGNKLNIYQYGVLQLSVNADNIFDGTEHRLLESNFKFKRFAVTDGINLPVSMMYDNKGEIDNQIDQNIFLADYGNQVLDSSSLSTRIVKDIVSEGNWIYSLYNDGTIDAFNRPRGVDRGVTLETVSYDPILEEITFVTDDAEKKEYKVQVPTQTISANETPSGLGILTEENVHKELVYGKGVDLVKASAGKNAISFYNDPYVNIDRFYITDPDKAVGGLDYSKRLNMKSTISPGDGKFPRFTDTPNDPRSWVPLSFESTTTDVDIFKIQNGKVTLPKGNFYLRGFINLIYSNSEVYGFRITDGENDIFSKIWDSYKNNTLRRESTRFEISENIYLSKETVIEVEEYFYKISLFFTVPSDFGPSLVSQLEFFKL